MWHGPASHTPAASIVVKLRSRRQDPLRPKATMWHGPASHAPQSGFLLPLLQVKRQNLDDSRPKATMWHGPATFGHASTPTESPMVRKRQSPDSSPPKASMWHGPASNPSFELSTSTTDVERQLSPTSLNTNPLAGLNPDSGIASPAALLPVSTFEPRPSTANPDGTMSSVSAGSTATPDSTEREQLIELLGL
ncbi:hypothetical protein E2P81_ATG03397 [Venturia nashicola]|nr:hypothetical protein E2P81_ATG03397 [Venturia nashicola]